ncbi:MAG TPA: hypothetical protein EYH05_05565 [Anaerolineae bacterium]|nr:hypothetical protein [Anaerolineae bacterium]
MEEERPDNEADTQVTPPEDNATPEVSSDSSNKSKGLIIAGVVVVALLIIAGLFLPPISLGERLSGGGDEPETAAATEAAPEEESTAETETAVNTNIPDEFDMMVDDPNTAVNVAAIPPADMASANVGPLPAYVAVKSNVYVIEADDPASGRIAIKYPPNSNPDTLDIYGWDGANWFFVPTQIDETNQQLVSLEPASYQAYTLVNTDTETVAVGGTTLSDVPEAVKPFLTEVMAGTLLLAGNGDLQGEAPDVSGDDLDTYLWVTNVGAVIDQASLSAFLSDTTAQGNQINALVNTAVSGGYSGINLDYQGVDDSQTAAYTSFIQSLADALHAQDLKLIVTLGTPQETGGNWDSGGQDWDALGQIADIVYMQMPLDPTAYGPDGLAEQLLEWGSHQIDRNKLVALVQASAVDRIGESFTGLSNEDALANFGSLEFTTGGEEVGPGEPVEAALIGNATPLEWDGTALTYRYSYEDENGQTHIVWLGNPASLAQHLEIADKFNLKGVAVRNLGHLTEEAGLDAAFTSAISDAALPEASGAAIVWTIKDETDSVIASNSGSDMAFSWEGSEEPGTYTLNVEFALGDTVLPLASAAIAVGEPEEEVAEEPEEEAESADTAVASGDTDAVVRVDANVRVGPGVIYGLVTGGILSGTEVPVLGRDASSTWLYILMPDGKTKGWIFGELLDLNPNLDVSALEEIEVTAEALPPSSGGGGGSDDGGSSGGGGSNPPPPVNAPPVTNASFELGGQTHTFANPQVMSAAGMNWVKFQQKWGPGANPGDLAGRINNAHGAGFKVLLSIPGSPYPDNISYAEYVQYLGGVAALGPDAIEVWNEQNIDFEWPAGQIDPASYVNNMLAPAYNAIKSANPNVMVISGAPAPTGFDNGTNAWSDSRYIAGMAAAGAAGYMDCVGVHYNAGATSPSQTTGHPAGSDHYSWYFWPMLNLYANTFGKPVCFTELGYLSGEDYGGVPSRFAWAANTTIAQQAAWLAEAASLSASSGKVRLMIIFNVDFTQWGDDPQAGYAIIRKNGSCPACATLGQVMGR